MEWWLVLNPKLEIRNPKEARIPKTEKQPQLAETHV
jgi:hypothetical protein